MKLDDYLFEEAIKGCLENGFIIRYQGMTYEFDNYRKFLEYDFDRYLGHKDVKDCYIFHKLK